MPRADHEGWGRPVRIDWFSSFSIFAALPRSYAFFVKLLKIEELFFIQSEIIFARYADFILFA